MATRTQRKRPAKRGAPQRKRTSSRSAPRRAPQRGRAPAKRRPANRRRSKRPPVALTAARWTFAKAGGAAQWGYFHIRSAPMEVWGGLVALIGIAAGVGIYSSEANILQNIFGFVGTFLVGSLETIVPPLIVLMGILMILPSTRDHVGRILGGTILGVIALAGMVHMARGNKPLSIPLERLQAKGGVGGALAAHPVSSLLGNGITWILLALALGVALMIVTRTSPIQLVDYTKDGALALADFVRGLAEGEDEEDEDEEEYEEEEEYEDEADVYDEEDEVEDEEEAEEAPRAEARGGQGLLPMPVSSSRNYKLPSLDLLARSESREISARSIEDATKILEATLEQFKVDAAVTGYTAGPTVTRFEVELGAGVKVNSVLNLSNEIKYALASGELRFLAPIPGRSAIGIEVPNRSRQLVTLGDVLRSKDAQRDKHPMSVALGRDTSGEVVMANLTEMPHVLIAGATNSGKSSCINSLITSILARARPDQVRMILIDPKRVELTHFAAVPHLLTPVVTVPKKAASALNWVVREMEMRYETLAHSGMRNLEHYNEAVSRGAVVKRTDDDPEPHQLPYILVVVDELSDLMMVAPRDVENAICRIAQMARAVGIHLVIATQRPSVDVVTGVIKANVPSRLAFSVASQQDSRVILDQGGAEKLIGLGDMLYLHANSSRPRRIQGAWVTEREVAGIVGHTRRQSDPEYVEGVTVEESGPGGIGGAGGGGDDELLEEAKQLVVRSQLGSTSMLQRKLQVGFARAGRLMDLMEQRGIVGPSKGSKPRDVLMTIEELEGAAGGEES